MDKNTNIATFAGARSILNKYELRARKSLGQNFLIDPHVLGKIIRAADIRANDNVLEIGPGIGGLTQALAESCDNVTAVELDGRLVEVLGETFSEYPNVQIVHKDILEYEISNQINKVVANLPYYVTTPIIMHLLEKYQFKSITVMVQKEVAQRMASKPGNKSYGALSLAVQYYADVHIAANVPSNSFMPRPQVGSAVIHMDILNEPSVATKKAPLFANIKAGFCKRRKTLVNSLFSAELYPFSKEELADIIKKSGFSENVRGEALSLEEWANLTENLEGARA